VKKIDYIVVEVSDSGKQHDSINKKFSLQVIGQRKKKELFISGGVKFWEMKQTA
jgi:hypothetical protein